MYAENIPRFQASKLSSKPGLDATMVAPNQPVCQLQCIALGREFERELVVKWGRVRVQELFSLMFPGRIFGRVRVLSRQAKFYDSQ